MYEKTALFIIGAYRNFFENKDNFKKFVRFLKENKDLVIFAYVSKESQYQRWHNELFKKNGIKFYRKENKLNDILFNDILKELSIPYILEYYDSFKDINIQKEDNIKNEVSHKNIKNVVKSNDTFIYQMVLEKRCQNLMLKYEKENNIYFTRIIKTRPDIFYDNDFFKENMLNSTKYLYNFDFFYICNREQYEIIIKKIEYLNFKNYNSNFRTSLYTNINKLIKENNIEFLDPKHFLNNILLQIENHNIEKINSVIIFRK